MVGFGFLAFPGKLGHCAKKAASTLGRQHLGKLLWHLAVEGKLFELWKGKVTEAVMPLHELGLFVGGRELDILGFFVWRWGVEGEWSSLGDLPWFLLLRRQW
jgi:hypothetical protein